MYIKELIERYPVLASCEKEIRAAGDAIIESYKNEGKLLVCGNGGSCADSDHICGELLKSFIKKMGDLDMHVIQAWIWQRVNMSCL